VISSNTPELLAQQRSSLARRPPPPSKGISNEKSGEIAFTGPAQAPEPNERIAWKDTVKSFPGTVTRVIARFDLPAGTEVVAGKPYRYAWHCHILEHEDDKMMRPYDAIG
jgi:spore coat protein A